MKMNKIFLDKQHLEEFVTIRTMEKEILRGVLQREENELRWKQTQRRK